jgi:hypothetical protein
LVTGLLVLLVAVTVADSAWQWFRVLSGRKAAEVQEAPFVPTKLEAPELVREAVS